MGNATEVFDSEARRRLYCGWDAPHGLCVYDNRPDLLRCKPEIDAALSAGDVDQLKRIFEREGVKWIEPAVPEKYIPGTEY